MASKALARIYCLALPKLLASPLEREHKIADVKFAGNFRKHNGIDQRRSQGRHFSFRFFGIFFVQIFGYRQFQNGIAQKLQPFILLQSQRRVFV